MIDIYSFKPIKEEKAKTLDEINFEDYRKLKRWKRIRIQHFMEGKIKNFEFRNKVYAVLLEAYDLRYDMVWDRNGWCDVCEIDD